MKRIFLVVIALFTTYFAQAQQPEQAKSLLWRISGKGLTKPSYLFGTIHLICSADYVWTPKMKQSLAACEKVCFEMDMDDNAVISAATEGFMDAGGKNLSDYFTKEQYQLLKKFVKDSIGMDIALFQNMKPIAVQSLMEMKVTDCMDATSYEERIMKTAKAAHKEILGLEDPSEQIHALESMPADSVVRDIMESVTSYSTSKQEYAQMVGAYKRQELQTLYELITGAKSGLGENLSIFLDDRNKRWIARMTEKMGRNSVFFAVGAGHLLGNNGVINLLRQSGYKVEPIL